MTNGTRGLVINPTFDASITAKPSGAAIEAAINRAISIYESLFSDPIRVSILFRYSSVGLDGVALRPQLVGNSAYVYYQLPWDTYIRALIADATTSNDTMANAQLSAYDQLSDSVTPSSASGRAIGLDTPPAMFANGTVAAGGPYDGIVTLNSTAPIQFSRPAVTGRYDAQRSIEHEIDEVLGLGSFIGSSSSEVRPQDLFSWSAVGQRGLTFSGPRYFSIDGGRTKIVDFNQNSMGDFGDWLSAPCPQAAPYPQNAFVCTGQISDVMATSPEGINLDVIGHDLINVLRAPAIDVNGDGRPDFVLVRPSTQQTAVWYMKDNVVIGSSYAPILPAGWNLAGVADIDHDGFADFVLFNPSTLETQIWYLLGLNQYGEASGPTLPPGWQLITTADFNHDGRLDFVLFNSSNRRTAIWYLDNNVFVAGEFGPTLPPAWNLIGVADFDGDRNLDYLLFNPSTQQTAIWYLSGTSYVRGAASMGQQSSAAISWLARPILMRTGIRIWCWRIRLWEKPPFGICAIMSWPTVVTDPLSHRHGIWFCRDPGISESYGAARPFFRINSRVIFIRACKPRLARIWEIVFGKRRVQLPQPAVPGTLNRSRRPRRSVIIRMAIQELLSNKAFNMAG